MDENSLSNIFNKALSQAIIEDKQAGLSDTEIEEKYDDKVLTKSLVTLLNTATSDYTAYIKEHIYEMSFQEKLKSDEFIAHQNLIWGNCFVVSEAMYIMALEAAEDCTNFYNNQLSEEEKSVKKHTFWALRYIHGRCCQQFLEILHLMKLGFADCAYARWRSMYELTCNASFIVKFGETIAKQFVEHADTDLYKYEWANGARDSTGKEIKVNTFQDIQRYCEIDEAWKKQYRLACYVNHGSPKGTFNRLSTPDMSSVLPVGQSDYGIEIPAEHSAIALQQITALFLNVYPNLDAEAHMIVIHDWVEEIRKAYFDAADQCFDAEIHYKPERPIELLAEEE